MVRKIALIVLIVIALTVTGSALAQDPPPYAEYEVLSVTEYEDLIAGPIRTSAYLAPDGTMFAHVANTEICLYAPPATNPTWCVVAEDEDNRAIDVEEVRWSPDSRYLSFSTNSFLRFFRDPDLGVVDVEAQTAMNITDDGKNEVPLMGPSDDPWPLVDMLPRWSAGSDRILFLRLGEAPDADSNETLDLYTIAPDGSDLQQIGSIPNTERIPVYALDWSPDGEQIVFNYWAHDLEALSGVWISSADGSDMRQIMQTEPTLVPMNVTFSPDAEYVMSYMPAYIRQMGMRAEPEQSPVQITHVESATTQLVDDSRLVVGAAWSPEGHALAYLVAAQPPDDTEAGLYITTEPGEPGRLVYAGGFTPPTSEWVKSIVWADNDTILLSIRGKSNVIVLQLGVE